MTDIINLLCDYASGGAVVDAGLIRTVEEEIVSLKQRLISAHDAAAARDVLIDELTKLLIEAEAERDKLRGLVHDCPTCGLGCKECECMQKKLAAAEALLTLDKHENSRLETVCDELGEDNSALHAKLATTEETNANNVANWQLCCEELEAKIRSRCAMTDELRITPYETAGANSPQREIDDARLCARVLWDWIGQLPCSMSARWLERWPWLDMEDEA